MEKMYGVFIKHDLNIYTHHLWKLHVGVSQQYCNTKHWQMQGEAL